MTRGSVWGTSGRPFGAKERSFVTKEGAGAAKERSFVTKEGAGAAKERSFVTKEEAGVR